MTTFPGSPRLLKGGIVLIHPEGAVVQWSIALQYNPKTLTRSLDVQGIESAGGDRSEALRLTGPAVETIDLSEVEIDATDQLEFPGQNPDAVDKAKLDEAIWGIRSQAIAPDLAQGITSGMSDRAGPAGTCRETRMIEPFRRARRGETTRRTASFSNPEERVRP